MLYTRYVKRVVDIFIATVGFTFFIVSLLWISWYIKGTDVSTERYRRALDEMWKQAYDRQLPLAVWFQQIVFHNKDKYVFRPPRILVNNDIGESKEIFYELYGKVTFWDPDAKMVGVNSYIGKTFFVRLDPVVDGSYAIVPHLDRWGGMLDAGAVPVVSRASDASWQTLFCPSDIVSIVFSDKHALDTNSQTSPLVPKFISLSQRLCTP